MNITKAVIPAAGLGTRFLPATKAVPKELLPVVDIPIIQYIVEEVVASGIEDIIFVTGRGKNAILDHFDRTPELEQKLKDLGARDLLECLRRIHSLAKIVTVRQQVPRGLGDAVLCARDFIGDEPFAVVLGDDLVDAAVPCSRQMIDIYNTYKKSVVGVMRIHEEDSGDYGIVGGHQISERVFELDSMVEKPTVQDAPSNLAIIGRYILNPSIFNYLENLAPGKNDQFQLTDAMAQMMGVEGFIGYEFNGDRYDAGDKFGFLQANIAYALKRRDIAPRLKVFMSEMLERI